MMSKPYKKRTHCNKGHEFTNKNTLIQFNGYRRCRACAIKTSRNQRLKRKFGITSDDYNRMLKEQEGRCAICREEPPKSRLVVDHNHKTEKVRGLLCNRCNRQGLGAFHDSYEIVQRAAEYMARDKWTEILTLPSSS